MVRCGLFPPHARLRAQSGWLPEHPGGIDCEAVDCSKAQLEITSAWTLSLASSTSFLSRIVGLLGLADARRDPAALIERHVHPPHHRGDLLLFQRAASTEALRIIDVERDLGQEFALDLADVIEGRLFLIHDVKDDGVLSAQSHGVLEFARQQTNDRWRMNEVRRRMPDHLLIGGAARLEVGLRGIELGNGVRPARFGLGHVGARHLAIFESVLGLPELLGQHIDIGLAQTDHSLVAHHVDIGGDRVQRGLLHRAQALAAGLHRGFGLADGVEILKALEDGLT